MKEKIKLPKAVPVHLTMPGYLKENAQKAAQNKGIPLNEYIRDLIKVATREST